VAVGAEPVSEKKVGVIAKNELKNLLESGRLSDLVIEKLKDKKYSKDTFDLNFPMIRKVTDTGTIEELKKDHFGRNRYYAKPISICGKKYLLCSQWYEPSKPKMIRWIQLFIKE
jgi:hypothetical protein